MKRFVAEAGSRTIDPCCPDCRDNFIDASNAVSDGSRKGIAGLPFRKAAAAPERARLSGAASQ